MSKRLTALSVENAKPGTARREISDGGSGLYLIVQTSGHRSWAVRGRVNGVTRKVTLEGFPTLHEAREQAAAILKEMRNGKDPGKAMKIAKQERIRAAANTFAATAELYLNSEKIRKLRTVNQIRDRLTRLAFPHIGDKPVEDIKRSQITAALDYIEKNHGPVICDHTLNNIRSVLQFYATRADDYVPPLVKGMYRSDKAARARSRVLTDDEIRKVWATGNRYARFLLLTGARRNEVAAMQWQEIDGNNWTLPAIRNKVGRDLERPLSKSAMAVLPPRGQDGDFVFGVTPDTPMVAFSLEKRKIDAACGVTGWTFHDLRRTARTLLSRAGVNSDHAERCLGHVIGGMRGVYDRHAFADEKAQAFEALAQQINLIVNPPKKPLKKRPPKKNNVVQFKKQAA